jgi:hypothetical protein
METTRQLQADQAELAWRNKHKKAGTVFIGWSEPESDTRSFPCSNCGTRIESGALIKGVYDETVPSWLFLAVPLVAAAFGYLIGWVFDWGIIAALIAGFIACIVSGKLLFILYHGMVENRMRIERGLAPMPIGLGGTVKFITGLLAVLGIATAICQGVGGLALVVTIASLIAVFVIGSAFTGVITKKRSEARKLAERDAYIAKHSHWQVDRKSDQKGK